VKSHHFLINTVALTFLLSAWTSTSAQTPPNTLTLSAKVRDFAEMPNAAGTCSGANCPNHPDFNTFNGDCRNAVDALIDTTGAVNPAIFPFDNRNPRLLGPRAGCFTGISYFDDWFNDRNTRALPDQNRPFLYNMNFTRNAQGMYVYDNPFFFPLDNDSITRGITKPIAGGPTTTFGHLNNATNGSVNTALHNYGFTTEFHASFTYIAADATHPAQIFDFTGDDDVWVFINGKLVIDLGGVHAAEQASVTLNAATAANLGLENGKAYMLDFFLAERRIFASDAKITTSLQLATQKVATPVPDPAGKSFVSQVSVVLTTPTPGATIYYSTNGSAPDSVTGTKFDPTKPINITGTTTLKAIAYKTDWKESDIMTATYTKGFVASTLEILDQNGNPLPGYLSELNSAYTIKITTTQAGLASVAPTAATQVNLDQETVTITGSTTQGDYFIFAGPEPLVIGAATANDGKSQAKVYDSLLVRWVNPKDPTRDTAVKHIWIRPAPKQAQVFFSTSPTGTPVTTTYPDTSTKLYVFVSDQVLRSTDQPSITLETTPGSAHSAQPHDLLSLPLTVVSPGLYTAVVPVDLAVVTVGSDGKLQLQSGDQIKGTYVDPLDPDTASGNAGFGVPAEIDGTLSFTDKDGKVLANGIYWNPAEGNLYLTYKDDFISSDTVEFATLTLVNYNGTAAPDSEKVTVRLNLAKQVGTIGVWEGSIKLTNGPSIAKANGTAETYVLGQAHASIIPHLKSGTKQTVPAVDDLLIAAPDETPRIDIEGPGGTNGITLKRTDDSIIIVIKDQSLSPVPDTLYFNLSCTGSHDAMVQMMAIETGPNTGIYRSVAIPKTEGGLVDDKILQCQSRDFVKVSYTDPVYGPPFNVEKEITEPVTTTLVYAANADGTGIITTISDAESDFFYVVVNARNQNINTIDQVKVTMTAGTGESEDFQAVETGNATNVFIAKVPFKFVTGTVASGNGILEGKITAENTAGVVRATGKVTVDGQDATGVIDLRAAFDKVVKAYIKDTDGDGKGDKVYIEFENRLPRIPTTATAQWNSSTLPAKTADKGKISLNSDSTIVILDYLSNEFPQSLTGRDEANKPHATLPDDALFKGQNPEIQDSLGPVVVKAVKHPVNPNLLVKGDPTGNRDTLYVTLSEPLRTADFKQMLKFAGSCSEYAKAKTITAAEQPKTVEGDPKTYIVLIDNTTGYSPTAGQDCIFLNGDGPYTDLDRNLPPPVGVKLEGTNGKPRVLIRGYPPVVGLDPNSPSFQASVQDSRDSTKGGFSQETANGSGRYAVYWIPPYGFDKNNPSGFNYNDQTRTNDIPSTVPEIKDQEPIPENISAIQVISNEPYVARISIYDNLGNFLRSSVQSFGYKGELQNGLRSVPGGLRSFLVWDTKDKNGQQAGNGVYVWKVLFQFRGGKQDVQYTRTGILRTHH
jgi:fibro-slime domain-containing protein